MSMIRLAAAALACAGFAYSVTADAAPRRSTDPQASMVEQLNQESLNRARQGLNSPTPGPDTTANLNAISEQAAQQGRNMNSAPMPFR